jgi:hypothetical protein
MSSVIDICNLALSNIRSQSINSLEEASLQAQTCRLKYPILRDMMLNDYSWGFARKIRPLVLTETVIFNWAYAYDYPQDCMNINRLILGYEKVDQTTQLSGSQQSYYSDADLLDPSQLRDQVPYEIFNFDNKVIGVNQPEVRIDYRSRVTNPELFTVPFVMALSYLLASEVAVPIVGAELGRALRKDSLDLYEVYLNNAISNDQNEKYLPVLDSEYVTARR